VQGRARDSQAWALDADACAASRRSGTSRCVRGAHRPQPVLRRGGAPGARQSPGLSGVGSGRRRMRRVTSFGHEPVRSRRAPSAAGPPARRCAGCKAEPGTLRRGISAAVASVSRARARRCACAAGHGPQPVLRRGGAPGARQSPGLSGVGSLPSTWQHTTRAASFERARARSDYDRRRSASAAGVSTSTRIAGSSTATKQTCSTWRSTRARAPTSPVSAAISAK
jgi:hypothetical protein